jgi:hypothetical protein
MKVMTLVLGLAFGGIVWGQEGVTTLPANYRLQFENEWVKVTSVRYEPMQKLAPHTHTPNPSAYVYLNDGPPVIFRHIGGKGTAATRPATKAGAFRVYRGLVEVHEVENTGNAPSEFLRVEFKTAAKEPGSFWGKFERPAAPSVTPAVQFDHAQLKISRLWLQPGQELEVAAAQEPALVIALGAADGLKPGQVRWIAASSATRLKGAGNAAVDFLRVDFKTGPSS